MGGSTLVPDTIETIISRETENIESVMNNPSVAGAVEDIVKNHHPDNISKVILSREMTRADNPTTGCIDKNLLCPATGTDTDASDDMKLNKNLAGLVETGF